MFKAQNLEELKKEYRKLCFKLHPDRGGNEEQFKAMRNEYDRLFEQLKKGDVKTEREFSKDLADMIDKLVKFDDLEINIVGSWIWLKGNTYPIKDNIKELGFKWSKTSKAWYWFSNIDESKKPRRAEGLDKAKAKFGFDVLKTQRQYSLA